jgi:hypothetical protein
MTKSAKKEIISKPLPISKPEKTKKDKDTQCQDLAQNVAAVEVTGQSSKRTILITLLLQPNGATIDEMAQATGWQRHSIHGMMSGVLKKKLKLPIASEKEERGRVYRIINKASRL